MKKILLLGLLFIGFENFAQHEKQAEVKSTIDAFFKAMHTKDTLELKKVCSDKIILQTITDKSSGATFSEDQVKDFYKSIATIPNSVQFEERLLSYDIKIDGALANAWTPYEFYVNDKFSHKGVNAFTLFYENNVWKIIYIIDTRRKN
jgi:hypothetical protein